ncbi:MAG: cob(I)yrinic acid a,c-diamide adenosyltransferase [Candidatus Brocadiia bacterium]
MNTEPRVLVFTGDGKGKTTAALGMALRASGHGMRTLVIQFCKADSSTGEIDAIEQLAGCEILQSGLGWIPEPSRPEFKKHQEAAQEGLKKAQTAVQSGDYDLIVLDEISLAVRESILEENQVLQLIGNAPSDLCLVLTGRDAPQSFCDAADTVTKMQCIKHGLHTGRKAQEGVEK